MKRKTKEGAVAAQACQLRSGNLHPFGVLKGHVPLGSGEDRVYRQVREAIPVLDAAVTKLVRLCGGFQVECRIKRLRNGWQHFCGMCPAAEVRRALKASSPATWTAC